MISSHVKQYDFYCNIIHADYFKGDSAYFFTQPLNDAQLSSKNKDLIQKYILKCKFI